MLQLPIKQTWIEGLQIEMEVSNMPEQTQHNATRGMATEIEGSASPVNRAHVYSVTVNDTNIFLCSQTSNNTSERMLRNP